MKNFLQPGEVLDLTAPSTLTGGSGALIGSIFGVAKSDVTSGSVGQFLLRGVVSLAKATGAAWSQGDLIYWDNTAKNCTKTSSGNHLIGAATAAALSAATTGNVALNGNAVVAS